MNKFGVILLACFSCFLNTIYANNWHVGKEILSYYASLGDTLKMKAANYLLENMVYHNSISSSLYNNYYREIASINKNFSYPKCIEKYNELYTLLGPPKIDSLRHVNDTSVITMGDLVEQIDTAFSDWKTECGLNISLLKNSVNIFFLIELGRKNMSLGV